MSDEQFTVSILSQRAQRREMEGERIELEARRVQCENQGAKKETARFDGLQLPASRRLALDESIVQMDKRRLALDREDRLEALDERKKMAGIIELLAKKRS